MTTTQMDTIYKNIQYYWIMFTSYVVFAKTKQKTDERDKEFCWLLRNAKNTAEI